MSNKQFKPHRILFFGVFSLFSLLSLYVFQVNSLTTLAYSAKGSETALKTLSQESASLETLHRQSFGIAKLEQLAKMLRFERIAKVTYIQILAGSVAQNQ